MPQKQKSQSWMELKQAGNECFKKGQYGEATSFYDKAIKELEKSSKHCLTFTRLPDLWCTLFIFCIYLFTMESFMYIG